MKSFATSTFGALTTLFFVLAVSVQAAVLPRDGLLPPTNVPLDLIPKYFDLMDKCNADDDTPVSVLYEGGEEVTYEFDECITRKLNGEHAFQMPVFCKAVTCKIYRTDDCTGDGLLPIPIPLLGGLTIVNPFDVTQVIGGSAKCSKLSI